MVRIFNYRAFTHKQVAFIETVGFIKKIDVGWIWSLKGKTL